MPRTSPGRATLLAVLSVMALGACNNKRVARIDPTSVTDLSGRWNDTDSRLVAGALVTQAVSAPWLERAAAQRGGRAPAVLVGAFTNHTMEHIPVATFTRDVENALVSQALGATWASRYTAAHGGRSPALVVGGFSNRTMEHIPVGTFTRDVERALVGSGTVTVVAGVDERQAVRAERADQQQNATADTRARLAREQGAQYVLQGDVNAIEDAEGRERVVYYQVDATLVDLESNAKVWVGQHKIKKYIDRRRIGW